MGITNKLIHFVISHIPSAIQPGLHSDQISQYQIPRSIDINENVVKNNFLRKTVGHVMILQHTFNNVSVLQMMCCVEFFVYCIL